MAGPGMVLGHLFMASAGHGARLVAASVMLRASFAHNQHFFPWPNDQSFTPDIAAGMADIFGLNERSFILIYKFQ